MRTAPRVDLSVEDRDWLEKSSRSQVTAVRLSERALIILPGCRRADQSRNWDWSWHHRGEGGAVARSLSRTRPGRDREGCAGPRTQADLSSGDRVDGGAPDDAPKAAGGHALEPPRDGSRDRSEPLDDGPYLAAARPPAAPEPHLQDFHRSALCRETPRRSWDSISQRPSMRWCCAAMRRARCRRWIALNLGCL